MNIVDIIVPVYRGLEETKRCIESILACQQSTLYELIVINDHSPENELSEYLQEKVKRNQFTLLCNDKNLGFVATVNRGMLLHNDRDVILLNSDTEVVNNWLDRLKKCAYKEKKIGTVTPFSNNATICSYPNFCEDNTIPTEWRLEEIDYFFSQANPGGYKEIPTAVGFCMYIRRKCLQDIGYFDVETFGKGYGEENDFSLRAQEKGWKNVLCADTFIYHAGNVSFGDEHNERKSVALDLLRKRYPHYETLIHQFIADDPIESFRQRVCLTFLLHSLRPFILHVTHSRGGGTERYVQELVTNLSEQADALILRVDVDGEKNVELVCEGAIKFYFKITGDIEDLLLVLRCFRIVNIHYHHTIGSNSSLLSLPEQLNIPWNITLHDYYFICPQIALINTKGSYCGEPDDKGCNECLKVRPAPEDIGIESWRSKYSAFLEGAQYCLAPSNDTAKRFKRYYPQAKITPIYHEESAYTPNENISKRQLNQTGKEKRLRIVVVGALSTMKGADKLERMALYAKNNQLPLDFILIGYGYRNLLVEPESNLTISGEYKEDELTGLLVQYAPDIVWFPALWPETYSYTLSACVEAGLPIVAPDLGAFPERLYQQPYSWILPWNLSVGDIAAFFLGFRGIIYASNSIAVLNHYVSAEKPKDKFFSYQQDYFSQVDISLWKEKGERLSRRELNSCLHTLENRIVKEGEFVSSFRSRIFLFLVRLRASSYLRSLVILIPKNWQRLIRKLLVGD
jgi:GT2 family glycosyltransferase/glycosyltransferase involved in cell wall biosynthesis